MVVQEDLILQGKLKLKWGNSYIDILDSEGNLNARVKVRSGRPGGSSSDGFYCDGSKVYMKVGSQVFNLGGDTSGSSSLPKGSIVMYRGSSAPSGWYLYNRQTGFNDTIYIINESGVTPSTGTVTLYWKRNGSIVTRSTAVVGEANVFPTLDIIKNGNFSVQVSYSSSNESVATIDSNGNITLRGASGVATIRATTSADAYHNASSAEYELVVSRNKRTVILYWQGGVETMGTLEMTKGDTYLTPSILVDGISISQTEFKVKYVKYSSSNNAVAVASKDSQGNLELTIGNAGSAVILAETNYTGDADAQETYTDDRSIFYLTVREAPEKTTVIIGVNNQTVYTQSTDYTYTPSFGVTGAPKSVAILTPDPNGIIKNVSGQVLTLYANTTGSARIKISIPEGDTYKSASAYFTLTAEEDTPTPTPSGDADSLSTIIQKFNAKLGSGYIPESESGDVYKYLKSMYDYASSEFDNSSSDFFKSTTYPEATEANPTEFATLGYRGSNNTFEQNGTSKNAMEYWLMAMCMAELIPSSGSTTNNQTKLFEVAYDLGQSDDYGQRIKLYDNYTLKGDLTIVRLAASAIYAYKHDDSDISSKRAAARTALGSKSSTISGDNWAALGYQSISQVGYVVNSDIVVPPAPGPRVNGITTGLSDFTSKQSSTGLNSVSNYTVDDKIDQYMVNNYNLYAGNSSTKEQDLQKFKSQSAAVKTRVLEAATIPSSSDGVYFRSEVVKPDIEYAYNYSVHRYTFDLSSSPVDNDTIFKVAGPFSTHFENVVFNGRYNKNTSVMNWLGKVMDIANNCRYTTIDHNYKRIRPLGSQSADSGVTRGQTQHDQLSGLSCANLAKFFGDTVNDIKVEDDWPHDSAKSYPSGHNSQSWILALILGQNRPDTLIDCIKGAYRFGVNRTVGRFHWNSDCMYGRLFATMVFPLVNAMTTLYNGVKSVIGSGGGGGGTTGGSATFTPCSNSGSSSGGGSVSSNAININIHNNSGSAITVLTAKFSTSDGVDYGGFNGIDAITISNGATGSFNNVNISDKPAMIGKSLVTPYIRSSSWIQCNNFSGGTFNGGQTYDIYYGGSTPSTVSGGGGGGTSGNCDSSTITITNSTGSTINLKNNINFVLSNNDRSGRITLNFDNGGENRSLANGSSCTATFDARSASGYGQYTFRNMSTSIVFNDDSYTTNIVLYKDAGVAMFDTGIQLPSSSTFTNGTYTVTLGGSGGGGGGDTPTPTPSGSDHQVITIGLNITNNTSQSIPLCGEAAFVLGNPDNNGIYFGGYTGRYVRTGHISFTGSTLSPGETKYFGGLRWQDEDTGLGMGGCSPLDETTLAQTAHPRNVMLYYLEPDGIKNSTIITCNNLSSSIVFSNGGTYNVSIVAFNPNQ